MIINILQGSVFLFWGEFLSYLFGLAVQEAPFEKKRKPSVGQKLLPQQYKQNGTVIVLANCLVWISVVVVLAIVVSLLS